MRIATVFTLVFLLLTAAFVQGHAAPEPRSYETRILHDYSDDSVFGFTGGPGFDVIALDAREAMLDGEPALVLRLIMNGGCPDNSPDCPEILTTIDFTFDGAAQQITFSTDDAGATFTGNADAYEGPTGINDGARFAIDAWVLFDTLGIEAGSVLSEWSATASIGGIPHDSMPAGLIAGQPDEVGGETVIDIGDYTVRAPDYYIALDSAVRGLELARHGTHTLSLDLQNLVNEEQEVTLNVSAPDGIEAELVDVDGPLLLAPNFTQAVGLQVGIHDGDGGLVEVTATSSLGGVSSFVLDLTAEMDHSMGTDFVSPMIMADGIWNHTFHHEGVFQFHNHHMLEHTGHITVEAATGEPVTHTIVYTESGFEPHDLTVAVGDMVSFQNNAAEHLMVMGGLDNHGGEHEDVEDNGFLGIPAAPLPLLLVALAGLLLLRRR